VVIGVVLIASSLVVIVGCGDTERHRPTYDATNVASSWVDRDRGQSNALVTHGDKVCSTRVRDLYCLDALSGDESFDEQLRGNATAPSLAGETLVVADDSSPGGVLYAYALDGQQLWSLQLDGPGLQPWQSEPGGSPLAAGAVVVWEHRTGPSEELVAVDVTSGRERWRLTAWTLGGAYADGQQIYISINDRRTLVALDPRSGAELWRTPISTGNVVDLTPVVDGAAVAVIVDGAPGRVVVLDAAHGTQRWDVHASDVAVVEDQVIIAGTEQLEAVPVLEP
jgi:outer membrane protein assembly factor BamB